MLVMAEHGRTKCWSVKQHDSASLQTWQICFPFISKAKLCHLLPVSYIRALSLSRQGNRVNIVEAKMD